MQTSIKIHLPISRGLHKRQISIKYRFCSLATNKKKIP